jgi:hypothetical protein
VNDFIYFQPAVKTFKPEGPPENNGSYVEKEVEDIQNR